MQCSRLKQRNVRNSNDIKGKKYEKLKRNLQNGISKICMLKTTPKDFCLMVEIKNEIKTNKEHSLNKKRMRN